MLLKRISQSCANWRPFPTSRRPRYHPLFGATSVRMASTLPRLPIFEAIAKHDPKTVVAVHSGSRREFLYGRLLGDVSRAHERLKETGQADLNGKRIAFLVENSYEYIVTLLACLAARAIAVPLSASFPVAELQYILEQSEASILVSSGKFQTKSQQLLATELKSKPSYLQLQKHTDPNSEDEKVTLGDADPGEAAVMLYTSGTTNRPKGVLLPQSVLTAQCHSLQKAWNYAPSDRLLHVLPLHHIHGVVNAVLTPLFAGSSVEFLFPFNADAVWKRLAAPLTTASDSSPSKEKITFFTVVPTVYSRLLSSHNELPKDLQEPAREAISPAYMRLSISGSAALPTPTKAAWADLSHGSILLERYGMTEVGMALSCGLDFADRVDASVGWPLPSVQARLADLDTGEIIQPGEELTADGHERSGEVQLRGPTIFQEYWRNPEATASEFVDDQTGGGKWFKTGDVAIRRPVSGAGNSSQPWAKGPMYFIQGRKSADIIKSGGEKVSALEVERELLSLPEVSEAAVVAIPSGKWGQKVGAVVILNNSKVEKWSPMDMRRALRDKLAAYKIPQVMKVVEHIPRNAMGKINKKQLVKSMFSQELSGDEL